MTPARPASAKAFRLFADAVLAFSEEPGPENLERYLAASRRLEESRRAPRRAQAHTRIVATRGDAA
jgi:hypothetical protein